MIKTFFILSMLLLSGCCELFGICTSVSVHSSAQACTSTAQAQTPPDKIPSS